MSTDIYALINKFKVNHLEIIAYSIGLQSNFSYEKFNKIKDGILFFYHDNNLSQEQNILINTLLDHYNRSIDKLIESKKLSSDSLFDDIEIADKQLNSILSILSKTISETKL